VLDHSSEQPCFGSKIFIDATTKSKTIADQSLHLDIENIAEEFSPLPEGVCGFNSFLIAQNISVLIVSINKAVVSNTRSLSSRLFRLNSLSNLKAIILVDQEVDISNISMVIWYLASNIDPHRDTFLIPDSEGEINHVAIDGTRKVYTSDQPTRDWPNVVMMDLNTIDCINKKWVNLGLGDIISSPSLTLQTLQIGTGAVIKI
jgi:4-hydroxy-3-polyprenylbenzoate decarboxylase